MAVSLKKQFKTLESWSFTNDYHKYKAPLLGCFSTVYHVLEGHKTSVEPADCIDLLTAALLANGYFLQLANAKIGQISPDDYEYWAEGMARFLIDTHWDEAKTI
jgi:hypothetical protein